MSPLERAIEARIQAQQQAAPKDVNADFRAGLADTLRIVWGGPKPAAAPSGGGAGNVPDRR